MDPEYIAGYARALLAAGAEEDALRSVTGALKRGWNASLVRLFGELSSDDSMASLKRAEGWLAQHGDDPALLLTLGRMSLRCGLWGKARSYLESYVQKEPTPEGFRLLAEALEHLGDRETALRYHRQGLALATSEQTSPLPRLELAADSQRF